MQKNRHMAAADLNPPALKLIPDLPAAVKGILQMDLIYKPHQIHVRLRYRHRLVVITRTPNIQ